MWMAVRCERQETDDAFKEFTVLAKQKNTTANNAI